MVHKKGRWVKLDEWRGYWKPDNSIVGQSIYGEAKDREEQNKELEQLKDFLQKKDIPFRVKTSQSSNIFMSKRWIVIPTRHNLTKKQEKTIKNFADKNTETFHE